MEQTSKWTTCKQLLTPYKDSRNTKDVVLGMFTYGTSVFKGVQNALFLNGKNTLGATCLKWQTKQCNNCCLTD